MTYRNIIYNVGQKIHPWKFWSEGYKYMLENHKDLILLNAELGVNYKLYDINKYRTQLQPEQFVKLQKYKDNTQKNYDELYKEVDTTGICVMELINGEFIIQYNINNIFGNCMNQDARLYLFNDQLWLTYNAFIIKNREQWVKMMKRSLKIDIENKYIFIEPEQELLQIKHNKVEKNCVLLQNQDVLYEINNKLTVQQNGQINHKESQILVNIQNKYKQFHLSLSTPAVPYKNTFLSIGHMKIEYKQQNLQFLKNIDLNKIKIHGKYLYFMFLFTFDANYNIQQISDFFIPSINDNHLPYLLVFPSGLTEKNGEYYISYGEGDTRTKILVLNECQIDILLSKKTYDLIFLNEQYFFESPPILLHLGYFGKYNCGDDIFVDVFKYLNKQSPRQYIAHFSQQNGVQYNNIILGGGDVITNYFCNHKLLLQQGFKIAFGVGIPYIDQLHHLNKFNYVYLRNSNDYNIYKQPNYYTIPDIAWLLHSFYKPKKLFSDEFFKIGISIPRTFLNNDYIYEYCDLIQQIYRVIESLSSSRARGKCIQIFLIPFGVNQNNFKEFDTITNTQLFDLIDYTEQYIHYIDRIKIIKRANVNLCLIDMYPNYCYDIIDLLYSMDFMICGRFHSHIFSAIYNIPFVSLSCQRKCIQLMKEWNLHQYIFQLETNHILIPINFKSDSFLQWIQSQIHQFDTLQRDINQVHLNNISKIDDILFYWRDIISQLQ